MPGGGPLRYRVEYCDLLEEKMAEGFSMTAVAGLIGVAKNTLCYWVNHYPEFKEAVERAKSKRLLHWEKIALDIAKNGGPGSRATMTTFGLRNVGMGEWSDLQRQEISGPDGGPIKTETTSARELLAARLARLAPSSESGENESDSEEDNK
jgi:hypothetical protein